MLSKTPQTSSRTSFMPSIVSALSYLDTSVVNGVSKQRTLNVTNTVNTSGVSVMHVAVLDGGSFNDTPETLASVPGIV